MSNFNMLSAAVVAALAFAAPAHAYKVTTAAAPAAGGTAVSVANVDIKDAAQTVQAGAIQATLDGSDLIIGRTVGFTVKVALKDGAKFAANVVAPALGAALTNSATPAEDWVTTVAAGGQTDEDYVILKFDPSATAPKGVKAGALFGASGLTVSVKNVVGLATAGATVSAEVTFADPGTAQPILTTQSAVILKSAEALKYAVTGGDTATKIDVGTLNGDSKTRFSANGSINGTDSQVINVGLANVAVNANVNDATGSAFLWAAADTAKLTLTGTSFAAFGAATPANGASVYLVKNGGTCKVGAVASTDVLAAGTVTGTQVTFAAVPVADLNASQGICFVAPNAAAKVVIGDTKIDTSVVVTRTATTRTSSAAAAALPLVYNGPTARVDAFNPGSNANQVSYLRITNVSNVPGKATISRTCDDGTSKGSTSLVIGAGATVALTAAQLENGGGAVSTGYGACPAGQKARLDIAGEFGDMRVQNFLRNTGTIINTNVNNQN